MARRTLLPAGHCPVHGIISQTVGFTKSVTPKPALADSYVMLDSSAQAMSRPRDLLETAFTPSHTSVR